MQMYPESFPSDRRDDPMRRAEARVFDEIQRSRLPGFSYYEWQHDHNSPQLDFPIWLPGVGRFGIEVKGGRYSLRRGKWLLETSDGPQEKDCPLTKAWDATMALHDELVQIIGYETFFIAVVVFPDMEPDRAIASSAKHSNVYVLWGVDGLVDRLQRIAAARKVYNPPDPDDIEREVAAVTDDQVLYEPPADWRPPQDEAQPMPVSAPRAPLDVAAGGITIQHVDTLNLYTVSGWSLEADGYPGIDGPQGKPDPSRGIT